MTNLNSLRKINSNYIFIFLLILLSIIGGFVIIYATPYGVGQINDSTAYIAGARSIYQGTGYSKIWLYGETLRPIVAYPPLTSILVSMLMNLNIDAYPAFQILNAILFGSTILLIGILGKQITNGNQYLGISVAILFLLNKEFVTLYSYAVSEPVYITLMLLALELFFIWSTTLKRSLLLLLGVVVFLATFTRNAGLGLFLAVSLVVAFSYKERLRNLLALGSPFVSLFIVWRLISPEGEYLLKIPRNISFENINFGLVNLRDWFFVSSTWQYQRVYITAFEIVFYLLIAATVVIHILKKKSPDYSNKLLLVTGTHTFIYVGVLLFSLAYVEEHIRLSHRILSPLYVFIMLFVIWGISIALKEFKSLKWVMGVCLLILISTLQYSLYITLNNLREDGQGYSSLRFTNSPISKYLIENTTREDLIFTNSPNALYSASGGARSSLLFTKKLDGEALLRSLEASSQGKSFYLICYGCTKEDYAHFDYAFSKMQKITSYASDRDTLYYYDQENLK